MSKDLPFLFFAVVGFETVDLRRLHLTKQVQLDLTDEFLSQKDAFLNNSEPIDYTPGFHPEEQDQHFILKDYQLPTSVREAVGAPDAIPPVATADFENGQVRALGAMSQGAVAPQLLFQTFDCGMVLRRGFTLLWRRDAFDGVTTTGLRINSKLAAVFERGDLHFRSDRMVSRFLDLDQVFTEATDAQVKGFVGRTEFAAANSKQVLAISDAWVRRKISAINANCLLDQVKVADLIQAAAKYNVAIATKVVDGETKIVLPSEKRELKNLLRLLSQDFLECSLTADKFRVNSKAPIK